MGKRKQPENPQQLNLLNLLDQPSSTNETQSLTNDNFYENFDDEFEEIDIENLNNTELGIDDEDQDYTVKRKRELLTLKLLRQAIEVNHPDDPVMTDFAEYVLPSLLKYTIGVTAKGGKFFDQIDSKRLAEGKGKVRRDNAGDQSLNTHLLNGLFPVNIIEKRLHQLDTTIKRVIQEFERRIAIASFILHDFEKFKYELFTEFPERYKQINDIRQLSIEDHREIFNILVPTLGLDNFLFPDNPQQWINYLDDLLFIAYNAQVKNNTNLNLSDTGLNPTLSDKILVCLADLACLADRLSSIIKHPQDAEKKALQELIYSLSNGQLTFTYHSIAENRGVLTNVVNDAVMEAYQDCDYQPLLYLPTGVIYLANKEVKSIDVESLPDRVVSTIKELCQGELRRRQTGFGRDGKGMKYADYYSQFFNEQGLMEVGLEATLRILKEGKSSVAKSRSDKLIEFQQKGVLSADFDFTFTDDIRIDQLAEFGDLVIRKIWGDAITKIETAIKQNKKLSKPPEVNLLLEVAEFWNLQQYIPQLKAIQNINVTLKEMKLKGNTGGVPLDWYYLAAKYLEHHKGVDNIRQIGEKLINFIADKLTPIMEQYDIPDGWGDIRKWVSRVVMLPSQQTESQSPDIFLKELDNYNNAKKDGRGRQMICSLSHSAYTVTEQMESAVLFTPQVYTNKQKLQGSNAKRNISSIAGTEMMLRQILMNQTQAVGKRFEDGKYRYLYFYPTYYFTPETNSFLQQVYLNLYQTRFDTSIRNHFILNDYQANFERENYQTVDNFLIEEDLQSKTELPDNDPNHKKDRTFKLSYPQDKPLTFYFMALPAGKDPTDTESWVMPTWLAFAFPIILDVKTVVSESPIPPYRDGGEFEETVFLDSAPQAFKVLTQNDHFRLDYILEGWEDDTGKKHPAPLNSLTAAYAIHLGVNPKRGKGGYDANWGKLTELAKDFETSPLYVFSYLKKTTRGKDIESPSISKIKLYAYDFYPCFDPYVQFNPNTEEFIMLDRDNLPLTDSKESKSPLNHPLNLTLLYRKFYRANKRYNPKANAILKPIDLTAKIILEADKSYEGTSLHSNISSLSSADKMQGLVMVIAGALDKLMMRVHNSTAEGFPVFNKQQKEQETVAILEFAEYFVIEVFEKSFKGDRARLAGRQLNLLKDTCEFIYRLEQDRENCVIDLVKGYRKFYRTSKSDLIVQPIIIACESISKNSPNTDGKTLLKNLFQDINSFVNQVKAQNDQESLIICSQNEQEKMIEEFCNYFVNRLFIKSLRGNYELLKNYQKTMLDIYQEIYLKEDNRGKKQSNDSPLSDDNEGDE